MSNLEKIQKGMRVLQILSKIALIFAVAGTVLPSIGAVLVAIDMLSAENQFFHFIFVTVGISKSQLAGVLTVSAVGLLFDSIITVFAYRYFTAELKEGTPFTNAGADRIKQLGFITVVLSLISACVTDGIYEKLALTEWNMHNDAGSITLGIILIAISFIVRYGAELEQRNNREIGNKD